MGILRRNRDDSVNVPTATATEAELEAAAKQISAALDGELATSWELDDLPEAAMGSGPGTFRFGLVTDDPSWSGTFLARLGTDTALAREAAWMALARGGGFPAPEPKVVAPEAGVLVLPEPSGVTLTECMLVDMAGVPRFLKALGQLHAQLHAVPTGGAPAAEGDPQALLGTRATPDAVRAALTEELAWLAAHQPPSRQPVICHGELHPASVYMDPADKSDVGASALVVNWPSARLAGPELDVASTMAAFWFSPFYVENAMWRKGLSMAVGPITDAYLNAYREAATTPLDGDALRYWQAFQIALLAADVAHVVHHGRRHGWDPMDNVIRPERTLDDLRKRFWELTKP